MGTIQGRVPDPTGMNKDGIWVSPIRDLAHCTPYLVRAAVIAAEEELNSLPKDKHLELNDRAVAYAGQLAKFFSICSGENRPRVGDKSRAEALKLAGLLDADKDIQRLFGMWIARALLGAYFDAIGDALHMGEKRLGIAELNTILEGFGQYGAKESWWRRAFKHKRS